MVLAHGEVSIGAETLTERGWTRTNDGDPVRMRFDSGLDVRVGLNRMVISPSGTQA